MKLDPYRPPLDAEPAPAAPDAGPYLDRASWTARACFAAVAVALVYCAAKGLEMRSILWVSISTRAEAYNDAFGHHAAGMFAAVAAPAVFCAAAQPLFAAQAHPMTALTAKLAGVAPIAWLVGALLLADTHSSAVNALSLDLRFPAFGLGLVAAGITLTAIHYGFVIVNERARMTTGHRVAAGVVLSAMLAAIYVILDRSLALLSPDGLGLAYDPFPVEGVLHADLFAAMAVSAWLLAKRDRAPGVLLIVLVGVLPAALLRLGTTGILLLVSADLHLHDTYFPLGSLHAGGSVVLLVFVAAALDWLEPLLGRQANRHLAQAGGLVLSVGLHATTIFMLQLGRLGMPRRYAAYLDVMQPMQRAFGVASAVSILGAVLLAVAVLRSGSRADRGRTR